VATFSLDIEAVQFQEFQMTYPVAFLSDEPTTIREQMGNIWRGWRASSSSRRWQTRGDSWQAGKQDVVALALMAPSLVAEIAPLILLWDSHLPVWQMSVVMAGSWAFTWRLTEAIAHALCLATPSRPLTTTPMETERNF
jgi:hypothetical protein